MMKMRGDEAVKQSGINSFEYYVSYHVIKTLIDPSDHDLLSML